MSRQSRVDPCSHCDSPVLARGLCRKHYQRWAASGDPTRTVNVPAGASLEERLRHYGWTETPSGCWEWNASRIRSGYGRIAFRGKTLSAHRAAHEVWIGPIPDGLLVRHRCGRQAA